MKVGISVLCKFIVVPALCSIPTLPCGITLVGESLPKYTVYKIVGWTTPLLIIIGFVSFPI